MKIAAHDMPRSYWRKQADKNGIRRKTFDVRISRGWTPAEAATRPLKAGSGWKSTGSTTYEACRQAGLPEDAVSRYRRHHGEAVAHVSDEQIIERLRTRRTHSVKALAEKAGIKWKTLESRLREGWPLEKALTEPTHQPGSTIHQNRRRA